MATGGGNSGGGLLLLVHVLLLVAGGSGVAALQVGFYRQSCPRAERIVRNITWTRAAADRTLAGKLLRTYFHDCFPQGCDASVLLDGPGTEKAAPQNAGLGGIEVVDAAKAVLERVCPGTVSCADILALAARDAVSHEFGRPLWQVETGRRDARASTEADGVKLPHPELVFPKLRDEFFQRGLSIQDLVALSGAHTLGRCNCRFISPRLYTFQGNGGLDPLIDPAYAQQVLMQQCPRNGGGGSVVMDPASEFSFDTSYYAAVKANRGVMLTDAALLHDPEAAFHVDEMHDPRKFRPAFAAAMQRMGNYRVLTGSDGEIRRNCHFVN